MRKMFVLDTSVLVHDPNSYTSFDNSDVIIPIIVLEELDKLKKYADNTGRNARVVINKLDELSSLGEIHKGIKIDNNINIRIDAVNYLGLGEDTSYGDGKVLACAKKIQEQNTKTKIVVVSRDINLRVRARALGFDAEGYNKDKTNNSNDIFKGHRTVDNEEAGEVLKDAGTILIKNYEGLDDMLPNEYVNFVGKRGKGISLGRRIKDQIKLVEDASPWGLKLRNKEQLCAVDLLMDPNIPLVSLVGRSGGGKTLLSIASALEMVLNKKMYDSFMIFRPVSVIGKEIGFLPGSIQEKIEPMFGAISDAFSFLFPDKLKRGDGWKKQLYQYLDNGTIQQNPISYLRGRSIPKAFILVDETQNISKDEIKAILTRCGEGTKIVLTGDVEQVDVGNLDATNNGLSYVVDKFGKSELAGSIYFTKGERSAIATIASEIL